MRPIKRDRGDRASLTVPYDPNLPPNSVARTATITSPSPDTTERGNEPLNPLPWGWYLAIVAVILGAAGILFAGWSSIPDPVPSHWNASGQPTGFRDKQVASVAFVVFVIPVALLVVGVLAALADHSRQKVHGTGVEADRARMLSNLMQPMLARFLFLTITVITVRWLVALFRLVQGAWVFWGMAAVIVVLMLMVFRHTATITRQVEEKYPSEEPRTVFKWGLFYFNPDDDEMFVNSGGVNIPNFGNKYFWVLFAVLFGFTALITALASFADQS